MKKLSFVLLLTIMTLLGCSAVNESVAKLKEIKEPNTAKEKVEEVVKEYVKHSKDEEWEKMYSLIHKPEFTKEEWVEAKEAEIYTSGYKIKSYEILSTKKDGDKGYKVRLGMKSSNNSGNIKGVLELSVVSNKDMYQIDLNNSKEINSEKY